VDGPEFRYRWPGSHLGSGRLPADPSADRTPSSFLARCNRFQHRDPRRTVGIGPLAIKPVAERGPSLSSRWLVGRL